MVAGTSNTNNAPKVEDTIFPISQFKNSMFLTPALPAKLTITKDTEEVINLLISLGATPINPITKPTISSIPRKKGLRFPNKALNTPPKTAKTIPIRKAHALTTFSRDLIAMYYNI